MVSLPFLFWGTSRFRGDAVCVPCSYAVCPCFAGPFAGPAWGRFPEPRGAVWRAAWGQPVTNLWMTWGRLVDELGISLPGSHNYMWMTYFRVTTICSDPTTMRPSRQAVLRIPHRVGVSRLVSAGARPVDKVPERFKSGIMRA